MIRSLVCLLVLGAATASAGDAERGAVLVDELYCLQCHSAEGRGRFATLSGDRVPLDLDGSLVATYTPAALASVIWNHTPQMWEEMSALTIPRPMATEKEWEDVFAYLYSLQFRDRPAESRRGLRVFRDKQCGDCHTRGPGPAVSSWPSVQDPVALLVQMWNHGTAMRSEFREANKPWRKLNARDLKDLTAYVQSVQKAPLQTRFALPEPSSGKDAFEQNCRACHLGTMSLDIRLRNKTWMDIGAGLWNHIPLMKEIPSVSSGEMRQILAYTWEMQYQGRPGNAARGARIFEEKRCVVCHAGATGTVVSPAPGKTFTPFSMVALGWGPGRVMHQQMLDKGVKWPYLSADDMANLVAYLNTLPRAPSGAGR